MFISMVTHTRARAHAHTLPPVPLSGSLLFCEDYCSGQPPQISFEAVLPSKLRSPPFSPTTLKCLPRSFRWSIFTQSSYISGHLILRPTTSCLGVYHSNLLSQILRLLSILFRYSIHVLLTLLFSVTCNFFSSVC